MIPHLLVVFTRQLEILVTTLIYLFIYLYKEHSLFSALAAVAEEEEDDPLERTGSFCGGLIQDVKRRTKVYLSDFTDGFNMQCLLTSIFLYFSVFAPNVAFGSILAKKTDGWLGVSEVIFATCLCGVLFGLFAGQPLIIIGTTGPVLVFEQTIYNVSTTIFICFDWCFFTSIAKTVVGSLFSVLLISGIIFYFSVSLLLLLLLLLISDKYR